MYTVIVTGSNGMVGNALKRVVTKKQCDNQQFSKEYKWEWLTRSDINLEHYESVYNYFEKMDFKHTIVVNLAANVGGLFKNMENNVTMFESNIRINLNVLEVCRKLKIPKVINILSTCIFPDEVEFPLTEEKINNGPPHDSNSGYSYSKRIGQIYSNLINSIDENNYNYINLIPTNLFGYNDNYDIQDAHVIPAIIHKCVKYVKEKKQKVLILPGDGEAERMFLYDEDFANVILDMIHFQNIKGDYIVSGNIEHSVKIQEIATMISNNVSRISGINITIEFEHNSKGNGQNKKPCSNEKLHELYSNNGIEMPIIDNIGDNLERIIIWFWENYDDYTRK